MCRVRRCRPVALPSGRAARRGLSRCGAQRLLGSEAARFTLRRQPTNGWRGGASRKRTDLPGVRDGSAPSPARPRWLRHAPPVSGSACIKRRGARGSRSSWPAASLSQRSRGAAAASRGKRNLLIKPRGVYNSLRGLYAGRTIGVAKASPSPTFHARPGPAMRFRKTSRNFSSSPG